MAGECAVQVDRSGCEPFEVAVQTASLGDLNYLSLFWRLHRTRLRAVHGKRLMTSPTMIMREVGGKVAP
jgi:hypothetical protein